MIVIDINVFVGACLGKGASSRVIELCLLDQVTPAMGSSLLLEFEDVMARSELFESCRLSAAERDELLDIFLAHTKWIKTYFSWRPNLRDEGDNHVLELAVACGASHLVTWNTRDFSSMELRFAQLKIMTPPEFLKESKT